MSDEVAVLPARASEVSQSDEDFSGSVSRETLSAVEQASGPLEPDEPHDAGAHESVEHADPDAHDLDGDYSGDVSRETPEAAPKNLRRHDSPIARAARQAVDIKTGSIRLPKPSATRVIGAANQKGGVGKTTSTVNLGVALALGGLKVLLIDLDPQGNASTAVGATHTAGTPSVYDVLVDGASIQETVQTCPHAPGLKCLPATIDLAGAEIELVSAPEREHRLRHAIAQTASEYDYVLIDCPPSLGLLTINAMVAAREVLIPIQCEYYALEGLGQLMHNIDLIKQALNPQLDVSTILLTMYDARTKLAEQVADEVKGFFGPKVLSTMIPRSVKVSEAPGFGQSVITYDPGSRGAMSYLDAAREIAQRGVAPKDAP